MALAELVEHVAKSRPQLLAGVPAEKALPLVRAVFMDVARAIDATEEGIVRFGGLREFRIRKVEREVNGEKVVRRHVVFRPGA